MALIRRPAPQNNDDEKRKSDRSCSDLTDALLDSDPTVRRWAARDLSECPESAETLVRHLAKENDLSVREVIFTTLIHIGGPLATQGLVACLQSEDPALRNEAVEAAKQLPEEIAALMDGLLNDTNSDLRILAVNILESLRHPKVEEWLIRVILNDSEVNVCATAVDLLSEVGSAKALEPLNKLKTRFANEPYIQFTVDLALTRIGDS